MNINTKQILKKVLRFYKKLATHTVGDVHPERDWTVLLILSLVLFLISMGINGMLFFKVYEGTFLVGNGAGDAVSRETQKITEEIDGVEKLFDARKKKYQVFITESYSFVDPAR